MKKQFLVFLLLFAVKANCQNAYYDSKYIIDWMRSTSATGTVDREAEKYVLNKLNQYIPRGKANSNDSSRYAIVDSVYALIFKNSAASITVNALDTVFRRRSVESFIKSYPESEEVFRDMDTLIRKRERMSKYIYRNKETVELVNLLIPGYITDPFTISLDSPITIRSPRGNVVIPEFRHVPASDTIFLLGKTYFSKEDLMLLEAITSDTLGTKKDIFANLNSELEEGVVWLKNRRISYDGVARDLFMALSERAKTDFVNHSGNTIRLSKQNIELPRLNEREAMQQAQIRVDALQSQPTGQLANFKMPSQAEMVDALAIYIADRFKQEAIMYMVDRLKENMSVDSFFTVIFPETKKLLFSQDAYTVPHFGSEWRYAISKDYTLMPDHLLGSSFITRNIKSQSYRYMRDAWQLAKMIEKKYSYVEIIRNFAVDDVELVKTPLMKKFLQWSNIYNEQLFSLDKPQTFAASDTSQTGQRPLQEYWISPAKFSRDMTPEQLSLFLVMVKEYHKINVEKDLGIDLTAPMKTQRPKLKRVQKWMVRNLLILNQFQKNQEKLSNANLQGNDLFNGTTYWTFMNEIIASFVDTAVMKSLKGRDVRYLQCIADVNEVYSSFQAKNYSAAINQVMTLAENICTESSGDLVSQKLNINLDTSWVNRKMKHGKYDDVLSSYNSYFSIRTNDVDYKVLRDSFYTSIKELKKMLKGNDSTLNSFRKEYLAFKWTGHEDTRSLGKKMDDFRSEITHNRSRDKMDSIINLYKATPEWLVDKKISRLGNYQNCFCTSLGKAKSYAALLNDIMGAGNNSQNLRKVIEAHAAPPSSYKLKRYNRRTLDIGAYLGAYVGAEILPQQFNATSNTQFVYGFTVPVGFNYTWATLKNRDSVNVKNPYAHRRRGVREFTGASHTISFSIIDIAAPVAFRLTNGNDGALPKDVKWSQLISPGLHYRYGFKKSPICFSIGVQYTPQLRKINATDHLNAARAYVGVVFDMPMFFISK